MPEVQRPETARPRATPGSETPSPPTPDELAAIEHGLVGLVRLAGAEVDMPTLPGAAVAREGAGPTGNGEAPGIAGPTPGHSWALVRWPGRGTAFNHGALVRWDEPGWEQALAELSSRLREMGERPAVVVADGLSRPADLGRRLRALGWHAVLAETVMWTRRAGIIPHLDPGMRIEAVTAPAVATYELVERAIFELPAMDAADRAAALEQALRGGQLRAYLVRVGRAPVATARLASLEGLACLHGVGVVRARRRLGYGALITTIATRAGLATGHPLAWLSVSAQNTPALALYTSLDYRPCFSWELLVAPDH